MFRLTQYTWKHFAILGVFAAAGVALLRAVQAYDCGDVAARLQQLPASNLGSAVLLTLASYAVLAGYDHLGLRYLGKPLPLPRVAFASFVSYVFSYNVGLSWLGGGIVRYRLYSAWGLTAFDVARLVAFSSLTFWLGCLTLAGLAFLSAPVPLPVGLADWLSLQPLGVLLLLAVAGYLVATMWRRELVLWGHKMALPSTSVGAAQLLVSTIDCLLAAGALYALLPASLPLGFWQFLSIYLTGIVLGMVSHVPGGLGVFEAVLLYALRDRLPPADVLGALVAYRAIYYLAPLLLGALLLALFETSQRSPRLSKVLRTVYHGLPEVVPRFLSLTVFLGGLILLGSGATPSALGRARWTHAFLPLPLMEASHFLGSLVGVGLLFLARGLHRRLDAAYHLTALLLAAGVVASLFKAFDYEEALALGLMLAVLLPCRRYFTRPASLFSERFTPLWVLSIAAAVGGSLWLGFFSYQHVEYSGSLFWAVALDDDAPRFLRASVGVAVILVGGATAALLRPRPFVRQPLSLDNMASVSAQLHRSPRTVGYLALLGDKEILFNGASDGFVMYGVEGRSWIAMGDPVGANPQEMAWRYHELVDRHGGWTVFYQVSPENLPIYIELGLTLLKLGEEAHVPLRDFSLEGSARKELRYVQRRLRGEGYLFTLHPAYDVPALLPEMRRISNAWLTKKHAREKGFSLGFFDPTYLMRTPVATVTRDGALVAFANVWEGAPHTELSVDLMRHDANAPPGVIDFLLTSLMLWGREQHFDTFNLGMAPFSGLSDRASASLWQRMGAALFVHGEHFYNFQGLRRFKAKYAPQWEPRYLASPGGLALPPIVAHLAALVARGPRWAGVK